MRRRNASLGLDAYADIQQSSGVDAKDSVKAAYNAERTNKKSHKRGLWRLKKEVWYA